MSNKYNSRSSPFRVNRRNTESKEQNKIPKDDERMPEMQARKTVTHYFKMSKMTFGK